MSPSIREIVDPRDEIRKWRLSCNEQGSVQGRSRTKCLSLVGNAANPSQRKRLSTWERRLLFSLFFSLSLFLYRVLRESIEGS